MMKRWIFMAAVVLAAGSASTGFGQSVLDDALNDKTAGAVKEKQADAPPPTAEPKPTRPKMADLVSPDAAKQLDDQDLLNKLTGEGKAGSGEAGDAKQKMDEIMERMGQSQDRLKNEKDPGVLTQEVQSRIVIDLDSMIELLKKQQQNSSSKGQSDPKQGEQKQETSTEKTNGQQQQQGTDAAQHSQLPSGGSSTPGSNGQDIHEGRLNWGDLPLKDRDLVANGAKEKYLPEYQEMIKRYYEALAELGKSTKER